MGLFGKSPKSAGSAAADGGCTTRTTQFGQLPEPLRSALIERIAVELLSVPDTTPAYVSTTVTHRRLGADTSVTQALVVSGGSLLIAIVQDDADHASVLHARLTDLSLRDRLGEALAQLGGQAASAAASGLHLTGFPPEGPSQGVGSYFFGLGSPDGEAVRAAVTEAIGNAKQ
jgi:hypothetical protein